MPRQFGLIVLLCEDMQQRCFAYRYLVNRGIQGRRIRIVMSPKGRAAAEQFVREQYPAEVMALRAKRHAAPGLIVVVDADKLSVTERIRELERALIRFGQLGRSDEEPIALLVPKRNIETWIHFLLGEQVNEEDAYAKYPDEQRKCEPAVREFLRRCPNDMEGALPSLQAGCQELTSLLQ